MDVKRVMGALLAALALMGFAAGCGAPKEQYEQSTQPFREQDVAQVIEGLQTVGDYVDAVSPSNYEWFYIGDVTGETQLTLHNPDGMVALNIIAPGGVISGMAEGVADELPADILLLEGSLAAIEWLSPRFLAVPTVRGVNVGDSKDKVLAAYLRVGSASALYTLDDLGDVEGGIVADWAFVGGRIIEKGGFYDFDTIEYGFCTPLEANVWKQYYNILYDIEDDAVRSIRLYVEGDER
jgi:hypothetical protein